MRVCLLCGNGFLPPVDLVRLFSFQALQEPVLCPHCQNLFQPLGPTRCPACGRSQKTTQLCHDCQRWEQIYDGDLLANRSLYHYDQTMHDLMVQYKRYGDYQLAQVLASLLPPLPNWLLVPIPTSPEHQAKRGFDTIEAIFSNYALKPLLAKMPGKGAQGMRNRQERLEAEQGFVLADVNDPIYNRSISKILLLDDIYTTGRTLYHARDCLRGAFPSAKIKSFTICR